METFPLRDSGGAEYAFEIPSSYFPTSGSVARFLDRCPGVSVTRIRKAFDFVSETRVEFSLDGDLYEVWEPFGDNSRFWVGSTKGIECRPRSLPKLEAYVNKNWPGPISRLRGYLVGLFRTSNAA